MSRENAGTFWTAATGLAALASALFAALSWLNSDTAKEHAAAAAAQAEAAQTQGVSVKAIQEQFEDSTRRSARRYEQEQFEKAEDYLDEAWRMLGGGTRKPDLSSCEPSYEQIGEALFNLDKAQRVLGRLDDATDTRRLRRQLHLYRGHCSAIRGDVTDARASYSQAVDLGQDAVQARVYMANALAIGWHSNEAKWEFERLLQDYPDSYEIHYALAHLLQHRLRDPASAEAHYTTARRLAGEQISPSHRYNLEVSLGNALLAQDKFGEAAQAYARARECSPRRRNPQLQYVLAVCYLKAGRLADALALQPILESMDPGYRQGDLETVAEVLERLAESQQ